MFFKKYWFLIFLFLFSSFLYLINLGSQDYSLDEAETVIIARTIFHGGVPNAWDGKELTSSGNGLDIAKVTSTIYLWKWHPWMQHYMTTLGLLLGDSPATTRIPFALLGVATIILFYFVALELLGNTWVARILSVQFALLPTFFLYARQVRYYSPTIFFSLVLFFFAIKIIHNKWERTSWIYIFLSGLLLFFSDYIVWAGSIGILFLLGFYKRQWSLLINLCIQFVIGITWYVYFKPYGGDIFLFSEGTKAHLINFFHYLSYTNLYVFPVVLLPVIVYFYHKKTDILVYLFFIFGWIAIKIIIDDIFLIPHGRYLIDIFPLGILLYGFLYLILIKQKQYVIVGVLFLFFACTNVFSLSPKHLISTPNVFATELTGKYPSMTQVLGRYLQKNYHSGDLFYSNGYTDAIYNDSGIPSISTICNPKTHTFIGPRQVTDISKIRWFIFIQHDSRLPSNLNSSCFPAELFSTIQKEYTKVILPIPFATYALNDPDIANRNFPPGLVSKDSIVIYQKY